MKEILCRFPVTIAELRRLNRETLLAFPLQMLHAIINCGIDLDQYRDAKVYQVIYETPEMIGLRYDVIHGSKPGIRIGTFEPADVSNPGYRSTTKLRQKEGEQ